MLGLLGSSGLLRDGTATADGVLRHLLAANAALRDRRRAALGPGVTARMRERAAALGCFLGFLRETKLEYDAVRAEADARLAAEAAPPRRDPGLDGAEEECQICFDAPRTHLFLPCGHRCACNACATIIAGGDHPLCPICRKATTGTLQVYL